MTRSSVARQKADDKAVSSGGIRLYNKDIIDL